MAATEAEIEDFINGPLVTWVNTSKRKIRSKQYSYITKLF